VAQLAEDGTAQQAPEPVARDGLPLYPYGGILVVA
jgi:hypothetical protein